MTADTEYGSSISRGFRKLALLATGAAMTLATACAHQAYVRHPVTGEVLAESRGAGSNPGMAVRVTDPSGRVQEVEMGPGPDMVWAPGCYYYPGSWNGRPGYHGWGWSGPRVYIEKPGTYQGPDWYPYPQRHRNYRRKL